MKAEVEIERFRRLTSIAARQPAEAGLQLRRQRPEVSDSWQKPGHLPDARSEVTAVNSSNFATNPAANQLTPCICGYGWPKYTHDGTNKTASEAPREQSPPEHAGQKVGLALATHLTYKTGH